MCNQTSTDEQAFWSQYKTSETVVRLEAAGFTYRSSWGHNQERVRNMWLSSSMTGDLLVIAVKEKMS